MILYNYFQIEQYILKLFVTDLLTKLLALQTIVFLLHFIVYILLLIHHFMNPYNNFTTIQQLLKLVTDITIYKTTSVAKPTDINTYRSATTVRKLSYIITSYCSYY